MTLTASPHQPRVASKASRWPGFVVTTLALASFGPYLVGSIRTEQAAVYGLLLISFTFIVTRFNPNGGRRFLIPWFAYIVVATLGVIVPTTGAVYESGNLLGGFDNLLTPLAVMLLIWSVVPMQDAERLLVRFSKIVAIAMGINGGLAIASTFADLSPFLRPFWSTEDALSTTAGLAAELGRYSGIFNQPAEAGALYGLGGIAAIYAWKNRPVLVALLLALMAIGGLISVSKIFIFGGLPVIVLFWFWSQRGGRKLAAFFGLGLIAAGVVQSGLLAQWTGLNYLGRLFVTADQDFLNLYAAGRFEDDSKFNQVVQAAVEFNALTGAGVAGWKVPYDGAIAEFLVIGGAIGLAMLVFVFFGMFALQAELKGAGITRMFAFLLLVLSAGASLGFSPLTANRVGTVSWVMIALLVLVARNRKASPPVDMDDEPEDEADDVQPVATPKPKREYRLRSEMPSEHTWRPNGVG